MTEICGIGFYWYNIYAKESSEKSLEQKAVTNICFKFSWEILLKLQKNKLLPGRTFHQFEFSRQSLTELSSTIVYGYKMSAGGSPTRNSQLAQGGQSKQKKGVTNIFRVANLYMGTFFLQHFYFGLWYHSVHWYGHNCRSFPTWGANSSQDEPLLVIL